MAETTLYLHQDDGATYKEIRTTSFDDAETEYSGAAGTIYTGITDNTIFSFDQDLGTSTADLWTIKFNVKFADITSGKVGSTTFTFYRVEPDDTEHMLFIVDYQGGGAFYVALGITLNFIPSDYVDYFDLRVYAGDRLKIVVTMGEVTPA